MSVRVYRVCRAQYARLDGFGASVVGGRWNSSGRAVVYMAQSIALAVIENLVHMTRDDFPTGYVVVAAEIPDEVIILSDQPVRAEASLENASTMQVGDFWIEHNLSAVMRAPSFAVTGEFNYLLNPAHADFRLIRAESPVSFHFDSRLFDQRNG
jgi:RES domain-containing protein